MSEPTILDRLQAKYAEGHPDRPLTDGEIGFLFNEIERLRQALAFYADERRYQGPNQRPLPDDPYQTDKDFPYILDVTRDWGKIARDALSNFGSPRQPCG